MNPKWNGQFSCFDLVAKTGVCCRSVVRVRDIEGLTYGIHSSFHATHVPGPFVVSVTGAPRTAASQKRA